MRMRITATSLIAATALLVALAGTAAAHELTVTQPQTGEVVRVQWIGGLTVPDPAQDAPPIFGPFRLPPSHGAGLPEACMAIDNSPAVSMTAPPFFTGCHHGQP